MKNHVITLLILIATASISRADTYHLSDTRQVTFSREDNIRLSIYSWPRTLVTYHVTFDSPGISSGNLRLTDDRTGRATPFQLSDIIHDSAGHMRSANVNFFAELPSGGRYSYTLRACANSNRQPHSGVEIRKGARSWHLGNEDFTVEIPAAPAIGGSDIPAPVMSITSGGRSTGCNHLISPGRKVTGLTATVIENGDLFVECGVRYTFDNGASYLAKVRSLTAIRS